MKTFARGLPAILGLVVVPASCAVLAASCGADPVGVEECRTIESARCKALKSCGSSDSAVTYCESFYRDQCLHGVANTAADLSATAVDACVTAINAVSTCAATGAMNMTQCSSVSIVSGADTTTLDPCDIIKTSPELLSNCAFLKTESSSSSSSSTSASSSTSSSSSSSSGSADAGSD